MADKLKRLRKILVKKGLKGQLKPVGSLEEAHIILIDNKQCIDRIKLMGKDAYKEFLDDGHILPSDIVHFLISANPRNRWNIEQHLFTSAHGLVTRNFELTIQNS